MNRIVFHVKRQYYEAFKRGEKTSEWRDSNTYWLSRLFPRLLRTVAAGWVTQRAKAWFVSGYPKNNLPRLEADITGITVHSSDGQIEIKISNIKEITT